MAHIAAYYIGRKRHRWSEPGEQRSQTNRLEKLVLDYCRIHALAGLIEELTSKDAPRKVKHGHKVAKG